MVSRGAGLAAGKARRCGGTSQETWPQFAAAANLFSDCSVSDITGPLGKSSVCNLGVSAVASSTPGPSSSAPARVLARSLMRQIMSPGSRQRGQFPPQTPLGSCLAACRTGGVFSMSPRTLSECNFHYQPREMWLIVSGGRAIGSDVRLLVKGSAI